MNVMLEKVAAFSVGESFTVSGSMLEGHFGDYAVKENIKEVGTWAHDNKLIYKDIIEVVWNSNEQGTTTKAAYFERTLNY